LIPLPGKRSERQFFDRKDSFLPFFLFVYLVDKYSIPSLVFIPVLPDEKRENVD